MKVKQASKNFLSQPNSISANSNSAILTFTLKPVLVFQINRQTFGEEADLGSYFATSLLIVFRHDFAFYLRRANTFFASLLSETCEIIICRYAVRQLLTSKFEYIHTNFYYRCLIGREIYFLTSSIELYASVITSLFGIL